VMRIRGSSNKRNASSGEAKNSSNYRTALLPPLLSAIQSIFLTNS
jgi:hypothetical protein